MSLENSALLGSQNARTLLLSGTFTLEALVKGHSVAVVTADVVQVLDLVDANNPVLTGEGLLERVELGDSLWGSLVPRTRSCAWPGGKRRCSCSRTSCTCCGVSNVIKII